MAALFNIESSDLDGQGVAHADGKVVFIQGALPGEQVRAEVIRQRKNHDKARLLEVERASSLRVTPACPHYGVCGGCAMQHMDADAQVAVKQRVLEDNLQHLGNVQAQSILPPIYGPTWGYRYRARLSARLVHKKGGVLVGFRERNSRYVADIHECHVLPPSISALLVPLRRLIEGLSRPDRIPQIELAMGDDVAALVLRHLEPLTSQDHSLLREFADQHKISWWLQPKGPDTAHPLVEGDEARLYYLLPQFGLTMWYRPTDFTQVNHRVNRALISRALNLLDIQPQDRVADMFCGLGNFSLPMATQCRSVAGFEGSDALVQRAGELAERNGLAKQCTFASTNLFEIDTAWLEAQGPFDRMLIDPPREGALALVKALSELAHGKRPKRLVYVSCNPATLARDAGIMVHVGGYRLVSAGVVNMFPHTSHIESIAVFDS